MSSNEYSKNFKDVRNPEKRSKSTLRLRVEETGKNNQFSLRTLNDYNKVIFKENKEKYNINRNKNKADNILKIDTKDINPIKENIRPVKYYDTFRISEKNKINTPTKPKFFSNHLENENKKLKEENENKKLKEENEKLKEKIDDCIKKLEEACKKLKDKDKIIVQNNKKIKELEKNIQDKENSLNDYLKENNKLKGNMEKLKASIPFKLSEGEKLISIAFLSSDQNVCYPIICKNKDIFIKIENLLYDEYPEYKGQKNEFFINGNKINKNGSLEENNIKDKSVIILQTNDNY